MADRVVLLATSAELPNLIADEALLIPALARLGVDARPAVWTDPSVDWGVADAVVVRSTWDYHERHADFLAWADRVGRQSALWNPPDVLRWNTHKSYLRGLAGQGLPVVPTEWLTGPAADLAAAMGRRGWGEVVVKPVVSAGACNTLRVWADAVEPGQALVDRLLPDGQALVQPYLTSVEGYGERSLLFLGGELSHAVRKQPVLHGHAVNDVEPVDPSPDEVALAERVIAAATDDLLYARVDIARLADGAPVLMELELTEPRLFLGHAAGAPDRLARAVVQRLRGTGAGSGGSSRSSGS